MEKIAIECVLEFHILIFLHFAALARRSVMMCESADFMKHFRFLFILLSILFISSTVWAGDKKFLAQYDCISSNFIEHVTNTYIKVDAKACYIDIYHFEQEPDDIIVVNYVDEPFSQLLDSVYGTISLNNNAVAILSGTNSKLFKKKRKKTEIRIENRNEINELNDGLLESFLFDGCNLYRCDYKNRKKLLIEAFL